MRLMYVMEAQYLAKICTKQYFIEKRFKYMLQS